MDTEAIAVVVAEAAAVGEAAEMGIGFALTPGLFVFSI